MTFDIDIEDISRESGDPELAARLRREEQLAAKGSLLQDLEPGDPLRMYLEDISAIPVCGDIHVLAEQLQEENTAGSEDAPIRMAVMEQCLSRVVEIACRYTGKGVLLMDLIQEGSMGLWEDLADYTGGNIEEFRDQRIAGHMEQAVLTQAYASGVGQKLRQAAADYRMVDEKLLAELGRNPTLDEIAEGLHMTPDEAAVVSQMVDSARALHQVKKPEPEELPQEEDQAVEDTAYFQMRQRITELLSGLSEQDAKLLALRYGLEGGVPMSPQMVGERLGLTPEEVAAREAEALTKLRKNDIKEV